MGEIPTHGPLAQWLSSWSLKPAVVGSIPTRITKIIFIMSRDDCMTTTITGYYQSTSSSTDDFDCSYVGSPGIGTILVEEEDERYNKILEIIRKQSILNMKSTWSKKDKQFKPMPIMKPEHRLQNICFNGRGWG